LSQGPGEEQSRRPPGGGPEREPVPREILEAVRRIEIRTRRLVQETFSGEYHSVFKGHGMEFREVREYVPGDDVRTIDWNVTARAGAPFVKIFEEERELSVVLVADVSRSGRFASGSRSKTEIAAELCGVLAFAAIANKDKVGLVLFSDRVELFIPPAKGSSHVLRIIRELLAHPAEGRGTDLNAPLQLVGSVLRRRATVFLVSDFWAGDFATSLRVVSRRHDCVAVRVRDPRETQLPPSGLVRWVDAETGRSRLIDTSDPATNAMLARRAAAHDEGLDQLFRRLSVDLVEIDVTRSYVEPLQAFFARRERRKGARA
jgi:uncharacterized protein (DUF58 family)